ncbi:MAG: ABC transporter permease, partial [Pseudomonadota bacterium]
MSDGTDGDGATDRSAVLWGALGVTLFILLWWAAALRLGSFALPTPADTLEAGLRLFAGGRALPAILETGARVMTAFALALGLGGAMGVVAGLVPPVRHMIGPLATMLLAIPPIAWIVLAVLWFGPTTPAVLFTVVVSLATVPYLAAVNGVAT